jgi:hypothetical protein
VLEQAAALASVQLHPCVLGLVGVALAPGVSAGDSEGGAVVAVVTQGTAGGTLATRGPGGCDTLGDVACVVGGAAQGLTLLHSRGPPWVHGAVRPEVVHVLRAPDTGLVCGGSLGGLGEVQVCVCACVCVCVYVSVFVGWSGWVRVGGWRVDVWVRGIVCGVGGWGVCVFVGGWGRGPHWRAFRVYMG